MQRGPVLEGVAYAVADRPKPETPYSAGDRVFHQKFGYGRVVTVDADKLTVDFDHSGEKKVIDSFVKPADRAG